MPARKGEAVIESYTNTMSRSGTGAHVFVPLSWIGKRVSITVIDDVQHLAVKESTKAKAKTKKTTKAKTKAASSYEE